MSMPANGSTWPPAPFDTVASHVGLLQAWWSGDITTLSAHAGRQAPVSSPWQHNGGVGGFAARAMLGSPQSSSLETRRLHVPIAADIARMSATVMAGEPPTFSIDEDGGNQAARERLDLILNAPEFHAALLDGEETASALGGVYMRVCWNTDLADHAWIEFVDPDRAIPSFTYGRLSGVTFWAELPDSPKGKVYRHFEHHSPGRIEHALFLGQDGNVGQRVPLEDHPATEGIHVDSESGITTGVEGLTAAYIPNVSPNPAWRQDPVLRMLGRSDITAPIMGHMDALNDVYSSLARDVRLAKARLFVGQGLLKNNGPGEGSVFDPDHEAYTIVRGAPNQDAILQAEQFDIRVSEHVATADEYVRVILRSVGFSPLTFGLTDEASAQMTATEVGARERGTSATKGAKSLLRRSALSRLVKTLLEVDALVYRTGAKVNEPVDVDYSPAVKDSPLTLANTISTLDQARAVSVRTKVDMLHPDWDEKRCEAESDAILAELNPILPDPWSGAGADYPVHDMNDTDVDGDMSPEDKAKAFDALGKAIRAGVDPAEAAREVGMPGLAFTGGIPVSLRMPESKASGLEEK